jgi:2-polyprenyl-3-methyl-5-hydroxy-6-metoxy-1,4-benzoquinol methylase
VSFATIDALRESLAQPATIRSAKYDAKMMHAIPVTSVVDRSAFILERVTGKRVLEFGASGPMHRKIVEAAAFCQGVDREDGPDIVGFDLDDVQAEWMRGIPVGRTWDVIVCGEVIEHLSNPGWFLTRLKRQYPDVPVIITAPNAFSDIAQVHLEHGKENVNVDHMCWYSYRTLRTLLERHGYTIEAFHYYNGEPLTAEGLIMVAR